ncbi:hypothetical protein RvY_09860 [Ramazzottius varieornatus]|uniref:Uncharacterized protein n=1 Tax=Ramazzottius varieornatus TaxID=947166 RepID=A0A1D1VF86_RAMVA|nr:hypothetical protein RvY_09860 [Ramazzottius varieornatus]
MSMLRTVINIFVVCVHQVLEPVKRTMKLPLSSKPDKAEIPSHLSQLFTDFFRTEPSELPCLETRRKNWGFGGKTVILGMWKKESMCWALSAIKQEEHDGANQIFHRSDRPLHGRPVGSAAFADRFYDYVIAAHIHYGCPKSLHSRCLERVVTIVDLQLSTIITDHLITIITGD